VWKHNVKQLQTGCKSQSSSTCRLAKSLKQLADFHFLFFGPTTLPRRHIRPDNHNSTNKHPNILQTNNEEEDLRTDSEVDHPLYGVQSQQGLNPVELAYNTCRLDGLIKLTASAFNRLKLLCQQSDCRGHWNTGLTVVTCRALSLLKRFSSWWSLPPTDHSKQRNVFWTSHCITVQARTLSLPSTTESLRFTCDTWPYIGWPKLILTKKIDKSHWKSSIQFTDSLESD